jgi:hypothetical protein
LDQLGLLSLSRSHFFHRLVRGGKLTKITVSFGSEKVTNNATASLKKTVCSDPYLYRACDAPGTSLHPAPREVDVGKREDLLEVRRPGEVVEREGARATMEQLPSETRQGLEVAYDVGGGSILAVLGREI